MIKLTRLEVEALKPCSLDKIPNFGRRKFMNARQAFEAGVSLDDLLWVAGKLGRANECVEFANKCAEQAKSATKAASYAASDAASDSSPYSSPHSR